MKKVPTHEQLMVFVTIAELGSLISTAKKLGVPATTVGRKLSELEQLLGVELIHRTTRQCQISGDGQYYLEKFNSLISEMQETARFLNYSQDEPEGLLKITAPVSYGIYKLQPILTRFQNDYPKVTIQLFLKNEYVDLVKEGFDLAIRIAPLKDSRLVARKIGAVAYYCVASSAYFFGRQLPQNPEDLKGHSCIGLAPNTVPVIWQLNSPVGDSKVQLDPAFIVNDPIYALEMAKVGAGIAYLPDFIVENDIKEGVLQEVLPGWKTRHRDVFAVFHNRSLMPLALGKLLSQLNTP